MQKSELTFDVIKALKEVSAKFQPDLFQVVKKELSVSDLKLLDYVFTTYYPEGNTKGRWYDSYHVLLSTHFAVQLERTNDLVSPLIIPGIILHDLGYTVLPDGSKKNWSTGQNRILHMQEGAAVAAKCLAEMGCYNPFEIGIIVEMVATHDNWILGIPTSDADILALVDADKVFIMSFLSFFKDWVSEIGHPADLSLQDFYRLRQDLFYQAQVPFTGLAKLWRERQFKARWQEIQQDILRNETSFRQYAERHIRAELRAGRG
ncbi:MAG: hypothetical protein ABIG29_02440 [Candidatus Nealsonbacteria bacterium]